MKRLLLLTLLVIPMMLSAQHLKFMGIPLDGTITNFTARLKAKGVTVSPINKSNKSPGCRWFEGTFFGNKAAIYVYFDVKTKNVYKAKACIVAISADDAKHLYDEILVSLKEKYHDALFTDSEGNGYDCGVIIHNERLKTVDYIDLYIDTYKEYDWSDPTYTLHIDYIDGTNSAKNENSKSEDL